MMRRALIVGLLLALSSSAAETPAPMVFDFSRGAGDWKTSNYESRVLFGVTNIDGVVGFAVSVPGSKSSVVGGRKVKTPDTAWGLHSPLVDVESGRGFSLRLRLRSTVDIRRPCGNDTSSCYVAFFDGNGAELPDYVPFGLVAASNAWQTVEVYGRVPQTAARLRVQLGCDSPDLAAGDSVVLSKLVLSWYPAGPAAADRVTLRDDGCVLVGGKPFFPVGVYNVNACEFNGNDLLSGMKELKQVGVNLVHTYFVSRNGTLRRFMDTAQEAGLRTWIPAGGSNAEFKERFILADRGHPSILAWYLGDDTASGIKPAEIFRRHELCHALDPDRITVQADYLSGRRSSRYLDYVNLTDAFLPEIYTVFSKTPTGREVSDVIGDMDTVRACNRLKGSPNRSVWPIIQYFEGWRDWHRYPTARELRTMTFAAIAAGAKGVIYYTYSDTRDERGDGWGGHGVAHSREHFETFAAVTREIAGLIPDLVARDASFQPKAEILSGPDRDANGSFPVTCLLKESGLLMAVNSATEPVRVRLVSPSGKSKTIELEGCDAVIVRPNKD